MYMYMYIRLLNFSEKGGSGQLLPYLGLFDSESGLPTFELQQNPTSCDSKIKALRRSRSKQARYNGTCGLRRDVQTKVAAREEGWVPESDDG